MDRRAALQILLAGGVAACRPSPEPTPMPEPQKSPPPASGRMPSIFLAHGSPMLLDDAAWMKELAAWGKALPRPKSILVLSAHWVDAPVTIGATATVPLVYDFYGFPEHYYQVKYASPGAPELGRRVRELLAGSGPVAEDPKRGLDHGAYVPLIPMYPAVDVPVLQISIPTLAPAPLIALGKALAPLRDEGVLIMGSGFITHNMRAIDFRGRSAPPAWAAEFDAWVADAVVRRDVDALVEYKKRAPGVAMSLPTHEHFVPLLTALGAALDDTRAPEFPIAGFTYGSFTKRSVQFG